MGNHDLTPVATLPPALLQRRAIVHVRQSTRSQVMTNPESAADGNTIWSLRRAATAFRALMSSTMISAHRPVAVQYDLGFERLVAALCSGEVGAVSCQKVSRLARNGRDWHHVPEICGMVEARVVDHDGVYDPRLPNDRLLLGMKGSISAFEPGILRTRTPDAGRAKARRGELRDTPPIGCLWDRDGPGSCLIRTCGLRR